MSLETDVAWAAGLFEGEGCISTKVSSGHTYVRFSLNTTDEDVIMRFAEIAGGPVYGPFESTSPTTGLPCKPHWLWQASTFDDVARLSRLFEPYLGERRRNALERAWHNYACDDSSFRRGHNNSRTHCSNGHELSEDNVFFQVWRGKKQKLPQCRTCRKNYHRERRKNNQKGAPCRP